jgi:hypothetical protein
MIWGRRTIFLKVCEAIQDSLTGCFLPMLVAFILVSEPTLAGATPGMAFRRAEVTVKFDLCTKAEEAR